MPVQIVAIVPDSYEIGKLPPDVLRNTLTALGKDLLVDFEVTTQTWREQPAFEIAQDATSVTVSTDDKIYGYINDGTAVRYATMTHDFIAKTRVRWIGSGPGAGGVAFINRNRPRPGIKAREFDTEIKEKWDGILPDVIQRMIDASVGRP